MKRRVMAVLSALVVCLGMSGGQTAAAKPDPTAKPTQAALASSPELSVDTRLADRREVAAGTRAYSIGFEDGRFYANGWHITGEMGGVWTPPLKLVDGVWFGLDDKWIGPATKFSSGWGYTRYDLPTTAGLSVQRTDFVPDGRRGALFGLTITNPGAARTAKLSVDAHSELMGQYPWGFTGITPNASANLPDHGAYTNGRLRVHRRRRPPGRADPSLRRRGRLVADPDDRRHRPQVLGSRVRPPLHRHRDGAPADPKPSQCDDGPFGNGTGGELTYAVDLPAGAQQDGLARRRRLRPGPRQAQQELTKTLANPVKHLNQKVASRRQLSKMTQLSLPGDPLVQDAIDWGKQNIADLTLKATNLKIRWTNQGKQFPAPVGTVKKATWIGAGYPDYPWIFGTDAEYTAFAAVSLGQFNAIKGHLTTLREVSDLLNNRSGVVTHEVVSDGSIYFGHDSRLANPDGTTTYDFNTDETVKFPSTVALIWRWTGDRAFLNQNYDFSVRNLRYVVNQLDADHDGWPEGLGNVERTGMGPEKLDNTVYLIRGLYDLADMAKTKHDNATYAWANGLAKKLRQKFDSTWWYQAASQYADSLTEPGNAQSFQKHWIGETPAEAELHVNGRTVPGLAPHTHGTQALSGRENACFSGSAPLSTGLFHTGCGGGADGKGEKVIFGLTTSIQSVGEGNYGRLGATQQQRYTHALADPMFAEPATGGTPDEQPGAMPEIFPSPDQGANIDRCWTCRSMFMQAWGNYGTAWPVVHQWLGVRPDLGHGRLDVVPQVPQGQSDVAGKKIRIGHGSVAVRARHDGNRYRTDLQVSGGVNANKVRIGHTLPRGAQIESVVIDGHAAHSYQVRTTNRGTEVTLRVSPHQTHRLVITTATS